MHLTNFCCAGAHFFVFLSFILYVLCRFDILFFFVDIFARFCSSDVSKYSSIGVVMVVLSIEYQNDTSLIGFMLQ